MNFHHMFTTWGVNPLNSQYSANDSVYAEGVNNGQAEST